MEGAPQPPELSLSEEAKNFPSFEAWLTGVDDGRIQQMVSAIDSLAKTRVDPNQPWDRGTVIEMVNVGIHFRELENIPPGEINELYAAIETQVVFEAFIRNGHLEREGEYTVRPGWSMNFSLTPKGEQVHGQGGDRLKEHE